VREVERLRVCAREGVGVVVYLSVRDEMYMYYIVCELSVIAACHGEPAIPVIKVTDQF
jgi:hypothetical protein